jgi:hypothetical protein
MKAAATAPKTPGAKNIEALAYSPAGELWIGFRSPVVGGKALLLPVLNPGEMLDTVGTRAQLGTPQWMDLGGLGLRDMLWHPDGTSVLLLAGPVDGGEGFALFTWTGKVGDPPVRLNSQPLAGLHAEALMWVGASPSRLLVLSDDGSERIGAQECKLCPPEQQRFKARFVPLVTEGDAGGRPSDPPS